MDFVARFHHFLFEVEEHLREARLLVRQREDGFIDDLNAQRRVHALPARIGHFEMNARFGSRLVLGGVRCRLNLQFARRLNEQQPVIRNGLRVWAENVCAAIECTRHLRGRRDREFRLTVMEVQVAGKNRLLVFHDVNVGRASRLGRKYFQAHHIPRAIHCAFGAQKHLIVSIPCFERNLRRDGVSLFVVSLHLERRVARARIQPHQRHTTFIRRDTLLGILPRANLQMRLRWGAVRICCQHKNLVLQIRDQRPRLRDRGNQKRGFAYGDWHAARFGMASRVLNGCFHNNTRSPLVQRTPGKIRWKLEIKAVCAVAVGLPLNRRRGDIHLHEKDDADSGEVHVRSYFPEALYINPEIITDRNGDASITIPVADSITTWRMAMLASTQPGALGTGTSSLKVFQDFFADLDLPVTLTQGDQVTLPVAVYNYTEAKGNVSLHLEPDDWFALVDDVPDKSLTVNPSQVGGEHYTLEAKRIGKFKLTLAARMEGSVKRADIVVREIEVVPNGREQSQVSNGLLESAVQHRMNFPATSIPGASKIFVRLYPGPLSQIMEGMDAILRMPGGCFEQTSSSTYPNVLALDYMKRT